MLTAAFNRQPLAQTGWEALTPVRMRNRLLGIFHYETVEAREQRAAKAIEEALRAVQKVAKGKASDAAAGSEILRKKLILKTWKAGRLLACS